MFNIAFPELLVIGVVALIVIGPDKLPKVARTAGLLLGRMQRFTTNIKSEIDRELKSEDLMQLQKELRNHDLGLNEELRQGMQPVESVIHQNIQPMKTDTKPKDDFDSPSTPLNDVSNIDSEPMKRSLSN
ncbi:Sec-independent protein translocase protein TatB [Methylophaga sp.]|uniref:Sec-independent protein translocase protein TatB n=1 Tax=Methylophaga sp. TaxID=2024840 RepID=UPI0027279E20|nr:Sec-independent protein translocase protein TatB [Methylophaga sp.]MDO8825168.1 Sec-independent protein translocase protein TatB [Methylophaga sp.]